LVLDDVVSSVGNQLHINAKYGSERALQLHRRVIADLKDAHGVLDEPPDSMYVCFGGEPQFQDWSEIQAAGFRPS